MPAKAIPPARDRLQSRLLVWIGLPVLCYLTYSTTRWVIPMSGHFISHLGRYDDFLEFALAFSLFFALATWRLKAATPLAAACGGMVCLLAGQVTPPSGISCGIALGRISQAFH